MLELIERAPDLAVTFSRNKQDLKEILIQIQLDLTTETNKADLGHTIFALKQIHDIFDSVILYGDALIEKSEKKKKIEKENAT